MVKDTVLPFVSCSKPSPLNIMQSSCSLAPATDAPPPLDRRRRGCRAVIPAAGSGRGRRPTDTTTARRLPAKRVFLARKCAWACRPGEEKPMLYPVILSGGSGTRLWPMSRTLYPKQLLRLIGEDSLLQQTVRRVADLGRFAQPLLVAN